MLVLILFKSRNSLVLSLLYVDNLYFTFFVIPFSISVSHNQCVWIKIRNLYDIENKKHINKHGDKLNFFFFKLNYRNIF